MNISLIGTTGLTGNATIKYLSNAKFVDTLTLIGRRDPFHSGEIIKSLIEPDCLKWNKLVPPAHNPSDTFVSCFGLDGASYSNKEYHDTEFNTIKNIGDAAKSQGYKNFIFYSTQGADPKSWMNIFKTKGESEEYLKSLKFENLIIFRVSVAFGDRDRPKNIGIRILSKIFTWTHGTPLAFGAMSGDEFGKATTNILAKIHKDPKEFNGVSIMYNKDIKEYLDCE